MTKTRLPLETVNHQSALQMRNISLLLGGKENWKQRLVASAFGQEVCDKALKASDAELSRIKKLRVDYYESLFTEEDRKMEAALKKAAEKVYSDCYETEEDI